MPEEVNNLGRIRVQQLVTISSQRLPSKTQEMVVVKMQIPGLQRFKLGVGWGTVKGLRFLHFKTKSLNSR